MRLCTESETRARSGGTERRHAMEIAGMSIGSWILVIVLIVWAVIAVKVYFFGGFKKNKKKGLHVGSCCESGDEDCGCGGQCAGCDENAAVRANAVMPTIKQADPQEQKQ